MYVCNKSGVGWSSELGLGLEIALLMMRCIVSAGVEGFSLPMT